MKKYKYIVTSAEATYDPLTGELIEPVVVLPPQEKSKTKENESAEWELTSSCSGLGQVHRIFLTWRKEIIESTNQNNVFRKKI